MSSVCNVVVVIDTNNNNCLASVTSDSGVESVMIEHKSVIHGKASSSATDATIDSVSASDNGLSSVVLIVS